MELKSWVHSAPLLLLPVVGRFTVVELTSLQLPGQGLKPSTTATEFLQSAKKEAANSSEKERGFADFGTMNGIFLKQTFF